MASAVKILSIKGKPHQEWYLKQKYLSIWKNAEISTSGSTGAKSRNSCLKINRSMISYVARLYILKVGIQKCN